MERRDWGGWRLPDNEPSAQQTSTKMCNRLSLVRSIDERTRADTSRVNEVSTVANLPSSLSSVSPFFCTTLGLAPPSLSSFCWRNAQHSSLGYPQRRGIRQLETSTRLRFGFSDMVSHDFTNENEQYKSHMDAYAASSDKANHRNTNCTRFYANDIPVGWRSDFVLCESSGSNTHQNEGPMDGILLQGKDEELCPGAMWMIWNLKWSEAVADHKCR